MKTYKVNYTHRYRLLKDGCKRKTIVFKINGEKTVEANDEKEALLVVKKQLRPKPEGLFGFKVNSVDEI